MRHRLAMAAALLKDPELLILDEPSNGLDPVGQLEMRALIRELAGEGRTILLSSHDMREVDEPCGWVAVIGGGRMLAEGTPEQLRGQAVSGSGPNPPTRPRRWSRGSPTWRGRNGGRDVGIVLREHGPDRAAAVNRQLVKAGLEVSEVRTESGRCARCSWNSPAAAAAVPTRCARRRAGRSAVATVHRTRSARPMFASLRAELLILRKSRVGAWALVLTAPLLTLVTTYLFQFLDYLGLTPVMYAKFGTPTQDLPALLPSEFAIQAVNDVSVTAPFIILEKGGYHRRGLGTGNHQDVAVAGAEPGSRIRRADAHQHVRLARRWSELRHIPARQPVAGRLDPARLYRGVPWPGLAAPAAARHRRRPRRLVRPAPPPRNPAAAGPSSASADGVDRGRGGGVLASLRSELLVMSRWPAMWGLRAGLCRWLGGLAHVEQYVLYLNAGTGAVVLASPSEVLPTILPGQLVPAVLNSIGHAAQERHRRVRRHAAVGHDRAAPAGPVRRGTVRAAAYDLRLPARRQHQHRHEPVRRGQPAIRAYLRRGGALRCWPSRSSSSYAVACFVFAVVATRGRTSSNGVTVRLRWRL